MTVKAWKIVLLVNGEQANDTQYVACENGDGWVGGREILLETVGQLTHYEMMGLIGGNASDKISMEIEVVDINPDEIFI